MDILALKMHSAIAEAVRRIEARTGEHVSAWELPRDDPKVFELIRSARTVGLFQLESSGQRNLATRLQERDFEDVVAAISLFRPGPLQAEMIGPFIRRRHGRDQVVVPHPAMERILSRTYGVIVYQEQVIEVASAVAGFSLAEADLLRRTMTHERSLEEMDAIGVDFVEKAMALGTSREVAEEVFRQLRGFAAYGFNKAHAACFAIVCNASAWLKAHYPAEFYAGILNNQPMGFYSPRVVLNDARRFGLAVLPLDVNLSGEWFEVERDGTALRVGLAYVKEMSAAARRAIVEARGDKPGELPAGPARARGADLTADAGRPARRARTPRSPTSSRARASAARSPRTSCASAPSTRSACAARSWSRRCRCCTPAPGRRGGRRPPRRRRAAPPAPASTSRASRSTSSSRRSPSCPTGRAERRVSVELELLGLNVSAHPLRFVRDQIKALGVTPMARLPEVPHGRRVRLAGVLERAQMPWIRSGHRTMFLTLEDETELGQVVVFNDVYLKYGRVLKDAVYLLVEGELQNDEEHGLAVVAHRISDLLQRHRPHGGARERERAPRRGCARPGRRRSRPQPGRPPAGPSSPAASPPGAPTPGSSRPWSRARGRAGRAEPRGDPCAGPPGPSEPGRHRVRAQRHRHGEHGRPDRGPGSEPQHKTPPLRAERDADSRRQRRAEQQRREQPPADHTVPVPHSPQPAALARATATEALHQPRAQPVPREHDDDDAEQGADESGDPRRGAGSPMAIPAGTAAYSSTTAMRDDDRGPAARRPCSEDRHLDHDLVAGSRRRVAGDRVLPHHVAREVPPAGDVVHAHHEAVVLEHGLGVALTRGRRRPARPPWAARCSPRTSPCRRAPPSRRRPASGGYTLPLGTASEAERWLLYASDSSLQRVLRRRGRETGEAGRGDVQRPAAHPEVDLDAVLDPGAAAGRLAGDVAGVVPVRPDIVDHRLQTVVPERLHGVGAALADDLGHRRPRGEPGDVRHPRRGRGDRDEQHDQQVPAEPAATARAVPVVDGLGGPVARGRLGGDHGDQRLEPGEVGAPPNAATDDTGAGGAGADAGAGAGEAPTAASTDAPAAAPAAGGRSRGDAGGRERAAAGALADRDARRRGRSAPAAAPCAAPRRTRRHSGTCRPGPC